MRKCITGWCEVKHKRRTLYYKRIIVFYTEDRYRICSFIIEPFTAFRHIPELTFKKIPTRLFYQVGENDYFTLTHIFR